MSLVVTIVGRPNVGKSTFFNRVIGETKALVHNLAGVTRDRLYGSSHWYVNDERVDFTLVDTGGLDEGKQQSLESSVEKQLQFAIEESDAIVMIVDGRDGLMPGDKELARRVRKADKRTVICVNKIDLALHEDNLLPFHELGFDHIFPVSASHDRGIDALMSTLLMPYSGLIESEQKEANDIIRLAIVGKPNVGKSRLLNYLVGEERSVVSDVPGTTRDPIDSEITYKKQRYLLIDTAGIRRQAKINETLESLTVLRSMRAVGRSDIVILVVDVKEGVSHQELRLVDQVVTRGRGLICFYNKCDLIEERAPKEFPRFPFVVTCSGAAKLGLGMEDLMRNVQKVMRSYEKKTTTSKLNDIMKTITKENPPPRPKGRQLKIRYITQTDTRPPQFQIFVNHLERLTENYKKYLENALYKELRLVGTPIRLTFKE